MARKSNRQKKQERQNWRGFVGIIIMLLLFAAVFWLQGDGHPRPESKHYERPADAVIVYEQARQRVEGKLIQIYQNSSPSLLDFYVSPEALEKLEEYLDGAGIIENPYRFVIKWTVNPESSEVICEDAKSEGTQVITLEFAHEVYRRVYLPYFLGKDLDDPKIIEEFLNRAESQINYTVFHEAGHVIHCLEDILKNSAESDARDLESHLTDLIGHVIFIEIREGQSLQEAMDDIGSRRP